LEYPRLDTFVHNPINNINNDLAIPCIDLRDDVMNMGAVPDIVVSNTDILLNISGAILEIISTLLM